MKFQQFLLTRFNVPIPQCPGANLDINWLAHRLHLFETYCLPSVENQTVQDFRWLLAVDARTNGDYLRTLLMKLPHNAQVVLIREGEQFTKRIRAVVNSYTNNCELVVSTRLDNDDAILPGYLKMVRSAAEVMNLSVDEDIGFIDAAGFTFEVQHDWFRVRGYATHPTALSPFLSAVEHGGGVASPKFTAFCGDHGKVRELYPNARVYNMWDRQWVQVIHDRNVANQPTALAPILTDEEYYKLRSSLGWVTKN